MDNGFVRTREYEMDKQTQILSNKLFAYDRLVTKQQKVIRGLVILAIIQLCMALSLSAYIVWVGK